MPRRLLLVDDYDGARSTMEEILRQSGFEVTSAANVPDALRLCCNHSFEVLLCDLHLPQPGDGFSVVSAMRHCNPQAVTIIYSAYPAIGPAMADIVSQADEILVKPVIIPELIANINQRLDTGKRKSVQRAGGNQSDSVAVVLERESESTIADWLKRVKNNEEIARVPITDVERTAHLRQLFVDLTFRLMKPHPLEAAATHSLAARAHGQIRFQQGYSAAQIVEESRILQVSIFETLLSNLYLMSFSGLLLGVMAVADEVDAQLAQAMASFSELSRQKKVA